MATTAITIKSKAAPEKSTMSIEIKTRGKEKAVWTYTCQKEVGLEPKWMHFYIMLRKNIWKDIKVCSQYNHQKLRHIHWHAWCDEQRTDSLDEPHKDIELVDYFQQPELLAFELSDVSSNRTGRYTFKRWASSDIHAKTLCNGIVLNNTTDHRSSTFLLPYVG